MKEAKDINGREVKVFDTIIYPGKGRKGPMILRTAKVVGIVAKKQSWRNKTDPNEVVLKVTYKQPGHSWETNAQLSRSSFMILPRVEPEVQ